MSQNSIRKLNIVAISLVLSHTNEIVPIKWLNRQYLGSATPRSPFDLPAFLQVSILIFTSPFVVGKQTRTRGQVRPSNGSITMIYVEKLDGARWLNRL